jgi:hypothetical protein
MSKKGEMEGVKGASIAPLFLNLIMRPIRIIMLTI